MKSILQGLLLVAGIWLCCEAAYTLHYARQRSVYTFDKVNAVLRESSQTMDEIRKGATTWREASKEQTGQTTAAMKSILRTSTAFGDLVAHTDQSLNIQTLPALTNAINQQNQSLLETSSHLNSGIEASQKLILDADAQINSPAIKESMDSLAEAAQNTATATNEAAASMQTIHAGLDYELKQLEAPVTKVKAALNLSLLVIRRLFF